LVRKQTRGSAVVVHCFTVRSFRSISYRFVADILHFSAIALFCAACAARNPADGGCSIRNENPARREARRI